MARSFLLGVLFFSSLFLQGCLSTSDADVASSAAAAPCSEDLCYRKMKPSGSINSCAGLSSGERTQIQNLVDATVASSSPSNGEFAPDAIFNQVEEIGRYGCHDSVTGLMTIATAVEATKTVDGDGLIDFGALGTRKLQALIEALSATADATDADAMGFLGRIANESGFIIDGYDGQSLQRLASSAIFQIQNQSFVSSIKGYHYDWNAGLPVCTTNYLLVDGTRTNSIADWAVYRSEVQSLAPTNARLQELIAEPRYCDGEDGFAIHKAALDTISFSTSNDEIVLLKSLFAGEKRRGSPLGKAAVGRLLGKNDFFSVQNLEDLSEDLASGTGHEDEIVRSNLVDLIARGCAKHLRAGAECSAATLNQLSQSATQDPYFIVRLRARQATDYLTLLKKSLL